MTNYHKKTDEVIMFGMYDIKKMPEYSRHIDILGVGSLIPVKNYGLFIDIVEMLVPEFPELRTIIIGNQPDPEEKEFLEGKIVKSKLERHVILLGQVEPDQVFDYMSRSKIFLHPSLYEGQSNVKMEAFAYGMYVISFDTGHTFPEKSKICNDRNDMLQGIRALLNQDNLDFTSIIYQTMDQTAEAYHKIYYR